MGDSLCVLCGQEYGIERKQTEERGNGKRTTTSLGKLERKEQWNQRSPLPPPHKTTQEQVRRVASPSST
jgi:hypothetical protein